MPTLRPRAKRPRVINISSDESEAEEHNKVDYNESSNQNWTSRRWPGPMGPSQHSPMLKNGEFGMFSQLGASQSHVDKRSLAERRREVNEKNGSGKRPCGASDEQDAMRDESPLFEPETPLARDMETDRDDDVRETSPWTGPSTRAQTRTIVQSNSLARQLRHRHPKIPTNHLSDTEPELTTHEELLPPTDEKALKDMRKIFEASPMPGNATLLDEYISVLNSLSTISQTNTTRSVTIISLQKEDASISAALAALPAEEAARIAAIAQACAAAIQQDMHGITFDLNAINDAMNKRREEAEQGQQEVIRATKEKREQYEWRREEIRVELSKAEEARSKEVGDEKERLERRKREVEEEGGMALGFEVGTRFERLVEGKGKSWCG